MERKKWGKKTKKEETLTHQFQQWIYNGFGYHLVKNGEGKVE